MSNLAGGRFVGCGPTILTSLYDTYITVCNNALKRAILYMSLFFFIYPPSPTVKEINKKTRKENEINGEILEERKKKENGV